MTGLWASVRVLLWKNWRIKQRESGLNRGRVGKRWLYPALLLDVVIPLSVILLLVQKMCDYNAQMVMPGNNLADLQGLHQAMTDMLSQKSLQTDQGFPEVKTEYAPFLLTALPLLLAKSNQSLAFIDRPDSLLFLHYLDREYPGATELGIPSYKDVSQVIPLPATASNEDADRVLLEYPKQHDWHVYAGFDVRQTERDALAPSSPPLEFMALFYQKDSSEIIDNDVDDQVAKFFASEWTFHRPLSFPNILPFQMALNLLLRENATTFAPRALLPYDTVSPALACQILDKMLVVAMLDWDDFAPTSPLGLKDSTCVATLTTGHVSNDVQSFLSHLVSKLLAKEQLHALQVAALPKRPVTVKAGPLASNIVFLLAYLFLWPYALLIRSIVSEKEQQLKEYLLIMGVPAMALLISWFLLYFLASMVVAGIAAYVLTGSLFLATLDGAVYFLLLLVTFVSSLLLFGIAITPIFNQTKTAAACAPLVYFVLSAGAFIRSLVGDDVVASSAALTRLLELLNGISSPVVFMATLHDIVAFDAVTLALRPITYETVARPCRAMSGQCVGYLLLGWYLEHVFPRTYGVQHKWYFPFQLSYWRPTTRQVVEAKDDEEETMRLTDETLTEERDDTLREASLAEYLAHCCPTLFVNALSKTYPNGKVALQNVSFGVRKGEIFGLLGPNGAGKSTTLAILSGMLAPTSGDALVSGAISVATDPQAMRQSLSVCFQQNILFDHLTVWEHLALVCALKATLGVKTVTEATWRSRLQQFRLEDKADAMAKTLSGGQKRKLSLVLSLVDASRVLLLDEPTAGMDLKSRLDTWDALKRAVTHRAVILTTHSMQEAQALCENIGIVADGKLKCCGSSLFLRNRFGVGYKLTVVRHDEHELAHDGRAWPAMLMTTLQRFVPQATIVSDNKWETRVQLTDGDEREFAALFRDLERLKQQRVIKRYAIAATNLEDVFVTVTEGEDVYYRAKDQSKDDLDDDAGHGTRAMDKRAANVEEVMDWNDRGWHHVKRQLGALLWKRLKVSCRDKKALFVQYVWPIAFFAIAMAAFQHMLDLDGSIETVTALAPSDQAASLFIASPANVSDAVAALVEQLGAHTHSVVLDANATTERAMLQAIVSATHTTFFAGIFVSAVNWTSTNPLLSPVLSYAMFYNESIRRALPVTLQRVSDAYCRARAAQEGAGTIATCDLVVKRGIYPPDVVLGTGLTANAKEGVVIDPDEALSVVRRIMVTFYLLMAMSSIAGSYVGPVAREKGSGLKRMQYQHLETTYASSLYWLAHFVFDYAVYTLAILTICLVLAVFSGCLTAEIIVAWLATMTLFGVAIIPSQYLSSLVFASHSSAQSYMSYLSFFQIMAASFTFTLSIIPGLCVKAALVSNVLQVFPLYTFSMAALNIVTISWAPMRRQCLVVDGDLTTLDPLVMMKDLMSTARVSVWSWEVSGSRWVALLLSSIVSTVLLLFIDQVQMYPTVVKQSITARLRALQRLVASRQGYTVADQAPMEDKSEHADMVRVLDVTHVYNPQNSTRGEAAHGEGVAPVTRSSGQVVALENVSFAVEKRDCVALLGVNGSGKSTMFEILTAGIAPTRGKALIDACDVTTQPRDASGRYGYCAQGNRFFEDLSVREHLEFFYRLRKCRVTEPEASVIDDLMERLDLFPVAKTAASHLSGGNKRRLMLALALLSDHTSLLLLDEPSAGVDVVARRLMWRVLQAKRHSVNATSCLFTTHSMEEAEAVCANAVVLLKGKVVWSGSIPDLKQRVSRGIAISVRLDSACIWTLDRVAQYTTHVQNSLKLTAHDLERQTLPVRQLMEAWEACYTLAYPKSDRATTTAARQQVKPWLARVQSRFEVESDDALRVKETEAKVPMLAFVHEWLLHEAFQRLETHLFHAEFTTRSGEAVVAVDLETARGSGSNASGVYETSCTDAFGLADVFQVLEDKKQDFAIAQYSVSELSLERIFEHFSG